MKGSLRRNEPVYNKAERDESLKRMREVAKQFYAGAVQTRNHPFIEFAGLLNEYITICERASDAGVDFTQANRHSGEALPIETYHAGYVGEKLGCIYGPSFTNPKVFMAFLQKLELPFDVKIVPKKAQRLHQPEE